MRRIWLFLFGCIVIGCIAVNINFTTCKQKNKQLMLRNIEALAGTETGLDIPCDVAGGFCYGDGMIYIGISLI